MAAMCVTVATGGTDVENSTVIVGGTSYRSD